MLLAVAHSAPTGYPHATPAQVYRAPRRKGQCGSESHEHRSHCRRACGLLGSDPRWRADPPADVLFEKDVVYGKAGDYDLKLDLSRRRRRGEKLPCVLVIHGGGWAGGDRSSTTTSPGSSPRRGYVCATVGYRLAPSTVPRAGRTT